MILVVVGRFSKGIHLGMLPATHTVHMVASLFLNIIVKLHGIARSLVSDRDPLFVNHFWHKLFRLSGILLRMSSTVTCPGEYLWKTCQQPQESQYGLYTVVNS